MRKNKSNRFIIFFIFIIGYLLLATASHAQTNDKRIEQLHQQIEQLEKEAEQYRGNIASEQAKAQSLQGEISTLNNQIKKIQTQITITSKNIDKTKIEIEGLDGGIFDTQQKISYKKNTIGQLILDVYKQENKKQSLEALNQQQRQQNNSLTQTKSGKNQILTQTKGQEAAHQKRLAEIEHQQTLFFTALKELETKIIQGGLYILHIQAQNLPPKGTNLFRWPEDNFYVTQVYGRTAYAKR